MSNPFAKSRPQHQPYAIYRAGYFIFHVCKTYKKPASEAKDPYARWFVWASSPFTYGSMEAGDTYRSEILESAVMVAADPEWLAAYGPESKVSASMLLGDTPLTPEEYIAQHATLEVVG